MQSKWLTIDDFRVSSINLESFWPSKPTPPTGWSLRQLSGLSQMGAPSLPLHTFSEAVSLFFALCFPWKISKRECWETELGSNLKYRFWYVWNISLSIFFGFAMPVGDTCHFYTSQVWLQNTWYVEMQQVFSVKRLCFPDVLQLPQSTKGWIASEQICDHLRSIGKARETGELRWIPAVTWLHSESVSWVVNLVNLVNGNSSKNIEA